MKVATVGRESYAREEFREWHPSLHTNRKFRDSNNLLLFLVETFQDLVSHDPFCGVSAP